MTAFVFQRLHVHSHSSRRVLKVSVCDSFETARRTTVVKGLMLFFTRYAYVSNTTLTDKGTTFTAELVKWTMEQAGISLRDETTKYAQTKDMIKGTRQKLVTILRINISADQPQWDQYVNIAVMAHNTTYHASLKCAPTEFFHGRTQHSAAGLKIANPIRVANQPTDISKMLLETNKKSNQNVRNIP